MKNYGIILFLSIIFIPIAFAFCGDGILDQDETCLSCPYDNPCSANEECIEGECKEKFFPPLFLKDDAEATIIIPVSIALQINELFDSGVEFASCLKGKYSHGVYQVTKMKMVKVIEQNQFSIKHEACPKYGTISAIHSHPSGNCELSDKDIFAFGSREEPTNAVVCGRNNFAFYSRHDFDSRMNYLIREVDYKDNLPFILEVFFIALVIFIAGIFYYKVYHT